MDPGHHVEDPGHHAIQFTPLDAAGGFPTAIDTLVEDFDDGEIPRTLVELDLCLVAGAIRDRQRWWEKLDDAAIVAKWRAEAIVALYGDSDPNPAPDGDGAGAGAGDSEAGSARSHSYGHAAFDFAVAETCWQATQYTGPARPAAADGTFCADGIPGTLLERLLAGAARIRETSRRDVHPGSGGLVVDLVHPSLYAYEQGVTPVLGGADVFAAPQWGVSVSNVDARPGPPPGEVDGTMCSIAGLAWLPAEFAVAADGASCAIKSYINSLHPRQHEDMYAAVADAFVYALPLLEAVLTELGTGAKPRETPLRVQEGIEWVMPSDDEYEEEYGNEYEDESDWASYLADRNLKEPPIPAAFTPPPLPEKVVLLKGRRLQVIVKLASIELSPEQPRYDGGSWHVEGMRNERIVATACMYLESENVAESSIEFRTAVRPPDYEQNDTLGPKLVFGLREHGPLVQPRGTSRTLPGRALAWPNTLQHRVRPFELQDKTRAGRRTILCFFLVDPAVRIRSTATVPPQMNEWIAGEVSALLPDAWPREVRYAVGSFVGGMTFEQACERRRRLMDERRAIVDSSACDYYRGSPSFFERNFALCEH